MYTCNISLHNIVEMVKAKGVLDRNCRVEVTHFILVTHHPSPACVCVFAHAWPCRSPSSASFACAHESRSNTRSIPSMHTPPLDSIPYIRLVEKQGGIESLHSAFGWRANGVIGVTLNMEYFFIYELVPKKIDGILLFHFSSLLAVGDDSKVSYFIFMLSFVKPKVFL